MVGTAMMGMIERMFCDISSILGKTIIERGWMTNENMIHYNLHETLDIKHSQDFFDVLAQSWERNEENRYHIEQGLRLGATIFNGLYTGLYEQRKRRLNRQYFGPHSRAEGVL
jgi:pyrroloquinoline-quinone synthase